MMMNNILIVIAYLTIGLVAMFILVMTGWLTEDDAVLGIAIVFSWILIIPVLCVAYAFTWIFQKSIEIREKVCK